MDRTTIVLPHGLKLLAQRLALKNRVSLSELIRNALKQQISAAKKDPSTDAFLDDKQFFEGKVPTDLSENHDDYLY
ncbi:MAG: hypothetical protein JKY15_06780 [Deltaproteobacteria bacterium]|nr:hypothetical protein [Deltaproteobacteria bacterium]